MAYFTVTGYPHEFLLILSFRILHNNSLKDQYQLKRKFYKNLSEPRQYEEENEQEDKIDNICVLQEQKNKIKFLLKRLTGGQAIESGSRTINTDLIHDSESQSGLILPKTGRNFEFAYGKQNPLNLHRSRVIIK